MFLLMLTASILVKGMERMWTHVAQWLAVTSSIPSWTRGPVCVAIWVPCISKSKIQETFHDVTLPCLPCLASSVLKCILLAFQLAGQDYVPSTRFPNGKVNKASRSWAWWGEEKISDFLVPSVHCLVCVLRQQTHFVSQWSLAHFSLLIVIIWEHMRLTGSEVTVGWMNASRLFWLATKWNNPTVAKSLRLCDSSVISSHLSFLVSACQSLVAMATSLAEAVVLLQYVTQTVSILVFQI